MATVTVYRPKNLPSSQPIINSTEQVHKSQLLTNLNINKIFPIPRHNVTNKNNDISNLYKIYYQNVWGLKGKTNEIMLSLLTEAPHLICLTEHHLKNYEIDKVQNTAERNRKMAVFVYIYIYISKKP